MPDRQGAALEILETLVPARETLKYGLIPLNDLGKKSMGAR
jgi:hypothetical protein